MTQCKHETALETDTDGEFWCPECGDTFHRNGVTEAAPAAPTKSPNRKPKPKPTDRNPLPMGVLHEHLARGEAQRAQGAVLPSIAPTRVAAPAKREAPSDLPAAAPPGVTVCALDGQSKDSPDQVKDFTSVDAEMPTGPWHGIPCPNRGHKTHPCAGIMETYRVIQAEKTGNAYWMRCPLDKVHVILSFQSADAKQ